MRYHLTMYCYIRPSFFSASNSFLSMYFWTLPETVRGQSFTNLMYFGILQNAIFSLHSLKISYFVSFPFGSFNLTTAATYYPYFSSDTATTWASSMPSILAKNYSISLGYMFSPPLIIISLRRPTIDRQPQSSITAISPDFIHPFSMLLLVASSSPQQFSITDHPLTQNYPASPALHSVPSALTIFAQRPGRILPTVVVLRWKGSVGQVWNETGEVSVMPQQLVMSFNLRS